MSVWTSDTQKTDLVKEIYAISESLVPTIFGKTLAPYLNPDPATSELEKDSKWDELAWRLGWEASEEDPDVLEELLPYLKGVEAYHVGTQGVYKLVNSVRLGRFRCAPQFDYGYIKNVLSTYRDLLCPSTQITPKPFTDKYCAVDESCDLLSRNYESVSECMKRLRVLFFRKGFVNIDQKHFFGEGRRDYTGVKVGNVIIFRGTRELTNSCIILTKKHLDYVIGCTMRLSNIYAYLGRTWNGEALSEAVSYIDFTIDTAGNASRANSYKVVKAFHKARQIMQMETLGSVLPECVDSEVDDYRRSNLGDILKLGKYREIMRRFRVVNRIELLHVYKWMPPPDFDVTSAFGIVKKYHMDPRPSGADPGASADSRALWKEIQDERKLHLAYAYNRMTGVWPPNLQHTQSVVTIANASSWDQRGCLPYYSLGKDLVSQVKDKQTVCASMHDEVVGKARADETNYLLWYMANKDQLDTDRIGLEYPNHGEDNYARVAYKPEAHKPDSRLFYMAPPKARTILGEFEGNLANIATFYPGCLMGKGTSEKKKILLDLMDPHSPLPGVDPSADYETFIIQFDLAKFSPKSNYNVTADYHKFWAKTFDNQNLVALADMGCKSTILHTTCGLKMSYDNVGADLEGFRGRLMTMFHADLLGTACRLARRRGITLGRSKLAVFIDDGAVKVAVKGLGETAVENVRAFLAIMREVYAAAGQDANPSKTCVSRVGGEMLAEYYVHGTLMPVGIKAAMRLYPDYENAATTITEEIDTLFSTCQGAVKDGADWLAIHNMYAQAALKCVNRWARKEIQNVRVDTLALLLMTPKSYGGFGLQPLQGLVTTAVTNLTAEGLAMLNRAARWLPGYRSRIIKIVTTPVVVRTPLSILRDPLRVRADTPVLMENRMVMAVVDWLGTQQGAIGTFVGEYNSTSLRDHAEKVAEALLDSDHISLPVLQRAWKSTPLCQVETLISKFKRSHTIIRFIGRDGLSKIRKANMGDLRRILDRNL
jgi:hypothetical protein